MSTVTERVLAALRSSEEHAWADYLHECREAHELSYDEVEQWAWLRLQRELRLLRPGGVT